MKKRLEQFLTCENLSQSQFADTIGVSRAGVSKILSGHNKPGFDMLSSIAQHYPSLNLEWLITGKGKMYLRDGTSSSTSSPISTSSDTLFDNDEFAGLDKAEGEIFNSQRVIVESAMNSPKGSSSAIRQVAKAPNARRSITKVVVFYSDNTFEELK